MKNTIFYKEKMNFIAYNELVGAYRINKSYSISVSNLPLNRIDRSPILAYILEDISTSKNYITNFEGWFHSEYDDQPYYTVSGIKWEEVYGLHFDFYEKEY